MTFVCGICKARYQVPDRRLDGRTTMMCRDCKQPMRASRESTARFCDQSSAAPPAIHPHLPAGITSAEADEVTRVRQPPSGLDAGKVAEADPGGVLSASPPPLDEWHVGLRDIAVGPLCCEEIGRMLAAGTLTLDSVAWRRGLGSWLPIRQIPELAPAKPAPLGLPSVPYGLIPASMPPCPPAGLRAPTMPAAPGERISRAPAARVGSGRPRPQSSIGPAPGRASLRARSTAGRSRSWTATLATGFGLALLMTGAAITGARLWDAQTSQAIVRPLPPAPTELLIARTMSKARRDTGPGSLPVAVRPRPEPSLMELPLGRSVENAEVGSQRHGQGRHRRAHGHRPRAARQRIPAAKTAVSALAMHGLGGEVEPEIERSAPAGLTTEQLSRVVLRGRVKLQRCYEVALRGAASPNAVRTQIEITVAAAGGVVNVETRGQALPGMGRCIERAVRKWRFPAATQSTHTEFPVVFEPGS
jgi:hypothetical protein